MTTCERRIFNALAFIVSITGFAYLVMKYAMETDDPFALVNHPFQPYALDLHLLAAPFLLLVSGMLVRGHIRPKLKQANRGNRKSGLITLWMIAVMSVSGYLLQVVTNETLYQVSLALHLVSGTLFAAFFLGHVIRSIRLRRTGKAGLREVEKKLAA